MVKFILGGFVAFGALVLMTHRLIVGPKVPTTVVSEDHEHPADTYHTNRLRAENRRRAKAIADTGSIPATRKTAGGKV